MALAPNPNLQILEPKGNDRTHLWATPKGMLPQSTTPIFRNKHSIWTAHC